MDTTPINCNYSCFSDRQSIDAAIVRVNSTCNSISAGYTDSIKFVVKSHSENPNSDAFVLHQNPRLVAAYPTAQKASYQLKTFFETPMSGYKQILESVTHKIECTSWKPASLIAYPSGDTLKGLNPLSYETLRYYSSCSKVIQLEIRPLLPFLVFVLKHTPLVPDTITLILKFL